MNHYDKYQENQILTASPEKILLMLYDGAIRFTRQAISGLEEGDMPRALKGIKNAMAIVTEFSDSLNHEVGGIIADDLEALYAFMIRELLDANINKDVEKLKVVDGLLTDLRSTWAEAIEINSQGQAQQKRATASYGATPAGYVPLSISK